MKQKEVILVGAGGHALSLAEFAAPVILGYISLEASGQMPGKWLGTDKDADSFIKAGIPFHISFIYSGLPEMHKRRQLIETYEKAGARFESLISPSAIVTPGSHIGEGSAVMAGAIVNRARLASHVVINSGAIVEHDCEIGSNTFIGPGAVIGGFTSVGSDCFIGLGARIGNGLTIASGVSVAMGAVVNRNLTEPGIYHGFPLKCFKSRK